MYKFPFITCLTFTLFLPFATAEEPIEYYTPENIRKFADFLYEQGDYLRAVGEYQRYLFYEPQVIMEHVLKIGMVKWVQFMQTHLT